jgi:alpha-2-macroglobulin-like protein
MRLNKLDKMMDEYVHGLLDNRQAYRIVHKIENDPEWQLAYEDAVERKRLLSGIARIENSGAPEAGIAAARAIEAASGVYGARRRRRKILRWSSGVAAAAAMLLVGIMWISFATISRPEHAVRLLGQSELISGSTVSLRAIVTDFKNNPSPDVPVKIMLTGSKGGQEIQLAVWRTDSSGVASGPIDLPAWVGDCKLEARAGNNRFQLIGAPIALKRASKVYLATDKPIYQPGQTIHMRTLVLRTGSLKPDAGKPVDITVADPAGNLIFRESLTLSDYGLAWANLSLDSLIAPGRYRITATAGDDESKQTVEISHYKLPAFSVKIEPDKPYYQPGQTVSGKIRLKYNFGKPVRNAKLELQLIDRTLGAAHNLHTQTINTGVSGVAGFEIPLPKTLFGSARTQKNANLLLSVHATDPAGQENTGFDTIPVSSDEIRVTAVAENGAISRGAGGKLYVVTSYPDGTPAKCIVDIRGIGASIRTDDTGAAVIETKNPPNVLTISARDDLGRTGRLRFQTPTAAENSLVLRTDKPIYLGGQTMSIQVIGRAGPHVFIDIIKDRQTVLTRTVEMKNGRGAAAIDIPPMLSGTLRLHAYKPDSQGQWLGRDAVVIVKQADGLKVTVTSDKKTHRPGQDAKLNFRVTDADGKPQAAAISLAGVDEAVFSLQQAAPGLEGLMNGLDEELLTPAIEVHGLSMAMMHQSTRYAEAVVSAAATQAHKRGQNDPRSAREADDRLHSLDVSNKETALSNFRIERKLAGDNASTTTVWAAFGIFAAMVLFGVSFASASTDLNVMKRIKWGPTVCVLIAVTVLSTLVISGFSTLSSSVDMEQTDLAARSRRSFTIPSATVDDMPDVVTAIRPLVMPSVLEKSSRTTPGVASTGVVGDLKDSAKPVRTRTYFPETMLWRPQIITDPQGRADLTVPLADSITTWRLSGSAVSKTGRLGRVSGSVRVFQPFFADVNAPTDLTRGDEISIPLVLYNYADKQLAVQIQCTGADGLTIIEQPGAEVSIDPGDVHRVMVRVKADSIGTGKLEVLARSGDFADAIRREIRIAPPGRPASAVVNGTLTDGRQTIEALIPADAVDGSVAVRLKVYPSKFSELLDGLEGIFRQPNGCFEQTSSTTYPNVMALAYMQSNGLENPEIQAKATQYIQMGYQRLMTFEIKGGGFDWFGRGPANVVLTAYGLMEFADMAKVHNVDPKLLSRTADWLASQQTSQGAWRFTPGCFHEPFTGGDNSELAITAYVTWAIAGYRHNHPAVVRGAAYIGKRTDGAISPYTLALCANALRAARAPGADRLVADLAAKVQQVGKDQAYWAAGGASNDIRATSLAILAMKGQQQYAATVTAALRWLASKRDSSGTWGATQSTIMALKALTQGSPKASDRRDTDARVTIGKTVMNIPAGKSDTVQTVAIDSPADGQRMQLDVDAQGAEGLPYQLVVHYYTQRPVRSNEAPVQISVNYDRSNLQVGQSVTVRASITNTASKEANMLLADVGTPPGFSVDTASLEKLRAAGVIDRYTVTSHGVIFYITKLRARGMMTLEYKMTARLPLKAQAAPTTVYPYYEPHQISAAAPTTFIVQ